MQHFLPLIYATLVFSSITCSLAQAADTKSSKQSKTIPAVTPIFSQILRMSFPTKFKPVYENSNGDFYIQEAVLEGENENQWTQMITVTGARDLAADPALTPKTYTEKIAAGFQQACPYSYSAGVLPISSIDIGKAEGYAMVASCGTVTTNGKKTGESALIITLKGSDDYYTVQWAERAPPSAEPVEIDILTWLLVRAKTLAPIRLCAKVAGETAPYPSCLKMK